MSGAARILVGTCSWTDRSLIEAGTFYPPGVASAEARLRPYAQEFPIVGVDSSYLRAPHGPQRRPLGRADPRRVCLRHPGVPPVHPAPDGP